MVTALNKKVIVGLRGSERAAALALNGARTSAVNGGRGEERSVSGMG